MSLDAARESLFRQMRQTAREIFDYALAQASIANALFRHVHYERGVLRICEDLYDLNSFSRIAVISIGIAAHAMADALTQHIGHPAPENSLTGIVAGSVEPASQLRGYRYFLGGHPAPNAESLLAANAILKLLDSQTAASLVIFLVGAGGSSIVEKPVDDEISLNELLETYRALDHSGAPIGEIDTIRKHISAVKGGRLARAAFPAHQVSLLVSDILGATPDALASGPTMPDSTTVEDCYRIAERRALIDRLPNSTRELFERRALEETPKSGDQAFYRSRYWTILSNDSALAHARAGAGKAGFAVHVDNSCDRWGYAAAGEYLLKKLRDLRRTYPRVCLLSGGELTVELTVKLTNAGIGGRNHQFALACAEKIAGENVTILSAGTGGIDGNSPAAGAIVDGTTSDRARAAGLDIPRALATFDAHPLVKVLGDSVETAPAGNNLGDLRILLAY